MHALGPGGHRLRSRAVKYMMMMMMMKGREVEWSGVEWAEGMPVIYLLTYLSEPRGHVLSGPKSSCCDRSRLSDLLVYVLL